MAQQQPTGHRAPWDHWWVLVLSSAALIVVVIALIASALGGGQTRPAAHPVPAVPRAQATATATPTTGPTATPGAAASAPPAVPAAPDAAGRVHYTGTASGSLMFASAACILGRGTVAEVQAPAPGGGAATALSMTRSSDGFSVVLSGKYLHAGATPGVTVQRVDGQWSVLLKNVRLTDDAGGAVTADGVVVCTATNVPG